MSRVLLSLLMPCFVVLPFPAHAWSALGHRLVGEIAQAQLGSEARSEVARLLAGEEQPTLGGVASWADEMRELPEWEHTAPDHYVNIRDPQCRYDAARDCADGRCVVGAIERHRATLADRSQPDAARREALKFLVHFVGDIHQPLHAGHRDDRGGNRFQINLDERGTNLHAVWDHDLLDSAMLRPRAWLRRLRSALPEPGAIAPAQWAETSCAHTNDPGFYPRRPGTLPTGYLEQHRPLAERRIREAGVRLAALLDAALRPVPHATTGD